MKSTYEVNGLTYVIGDLISAFIQADVKVAAHQANCYKTMGAGIAGQIAHRLPSVYNADLKDNRTPEERVGGFTVFRSFRKQAFYNLYGQYQPGRGSDIKHLELALTAMNEDMLRSMESPVVIGLPLIGCGIGGGDWGETSELIAEVLSAHEVTIYVYDEKQLVKALKGLK